jgi:DNA-binding IclR family transcriptional regulator
MKPATSIEKVCRVLTLLRRRPSVRLVELAEEARLLRSDTHRILNSLRTFGYVEQDTDTREYRLGLELLKLGHFVYQNLEVREVAKPFMRTLSEDAIATSNLAILDPHELDIIFVEQIDSPSEFQVKLRIGTRAGPHSTAIGKMLTAHQDPSTALRILKKDGMPKCTKRTITDVEQLLAEFEKIRALGYATDHEEAVEGACCISAPVRDHRGEVVAALSISMMAARLGPSQEGSLIRMVRSTAARISAELGYEAMHHSRSRGVPQPELTAQNASRLTLPPHRRGTPPHISK